MVFLPFQFGLTRHPEHPENRQEWGCNKVRDWPQDKIPATLFPSVSA